MHVPLSCQLSECIRRLHLHRSECTLNPGAVSCYGRAICQDRNKTQTYFGTTWPLSYNHTACYTLHFTLRLHRRLFLYALFALSRRRSTIGGAMLKKLNFTFGELLSPTLCRGIHLLGEDANLIKTTDQDPRNIYSREEKIYPS